MGPGSKSARRQVDPVSEKQSYDWAKAMLAIISSNSNALAELAAAANLDPKAGDLSDIDLSDLDLSGQDFRGWDLRNAKFKNTRLAGTDLRNALVDPYELIEALDWKKANLDKKSYIGCEEFGDTH
jgi:uncharacterized protein YjbI with pentapeptide repeats